MKVSKKATAFLLAAVLLVSSLFTAAPMYKLFAAEGETHGNFVIYGGTYGVDYEYVTGTSPISVQGYGSNESYNTTQNTPKSGGVLSQAMDYLSIKTSTPLTISTNGTSSAGIIINAGVHADLTFDNVNITAVVPVNIVTNNKGMNSWGRPLDANGNYVDADGNGIYDYLEDPTSLHLTLADGSVNTLRTTNWAHCPGIRCGEGSKLTIDDGRRNIDTDGVFVAPEQGRISRDAVLQDGTVVKEGDRLTLLDSEKPGTLYVYGGPRAAAIGGGGLETSGDMTFNGGNIIVRPYGENDSPNGAGAGIGGGHAGCGTTFTFNGGSIDSIAAYHSAGIGGGCTYGGGMSTGGQITYALTDAYLSEFPLHTVAGDITINGGYLKSQGRTHGNAFGQACGGNNNGKTITITGGTLLPSSYSGWYDIGGAGGDVIVTGGSVRLTDGSAAKFQSNGGVAWGDLDKTIKVFMTTINMSAYKKPNMLVDGMKITVNGIPSEYGMPSFTDESGNLYFWLPNDGTAPEVRVDLDLKDKETGDAVVTEPFFITNATQGAVLKQYVVFSIDEALITDENRLRKKYDGLAFSDAQQEAFLTAVVKDGIAVTAPAGQLLTNINQMSIQSQRLNANLEVDDNESITSGTNANVGKYQLTITSDQYANTAGFKDAFWGHRCYYKYAEITPAESKTIVSAAPVSDDVEATGTYDADTAMQLTAYVSPADTEAATCEAPTGKVQFYINGKPYGDPVSLEDCNGAEDVNAAGRKQSVAKINWTPTQNGGKYAVAGTQEIYAKYIVQDKDNYNKSQADSVKFNIKTVDQGNEDNGGKPIKVTDNTSGEVIPADNSQLEKIYGDKFTLTLEGGDTDETPVYVSSNPDVAIVDEDGNVTIVGVGEAVITATRPGNGAYNNQSQEIKITAKKKELSITAVDILDKYYNGLTNAKYDPNSVVIKGVVSGDEEKVKAALKGVAEFPDSNVGLYPDAFATFTLDKDMAALYYFKQDDGSEGNSIVLIDEASIKIKPISKPDGEETTKPDGEETTKPDGEETTKPDGEETTKPDGEETTKPDGEETTKPGGENTTNPDGEDTTKPGGEDPDDDSIITIDSIPDHIWTGSEIEDFPVVRDGNRVLIKDVDYTVEFKNNIDVGTAEVIITGKGNYEGVLTTTFKIIPPATTVTVNYYIQDGSGRKLADEVVIDGYMGDVYSTAEYTRDDFYGYQLVEVPENVKGVMTDKPIHVDYYYVLKSAKVIVNYIDTNNNPVADTEVINGKVFDEFETHRKDIKGYNLVDVNNNMETETKVQSFFRSVAKALFADKALDDVSGEMQENVVIINYIYDLRDASVVSDYVDENGNKLADSETQETKYFADYTTEAKEIKGYELKETPVNAAGKIDADETVVTFVYALKDSSVIINYVDENGKEIAASESTTGKYFEKYTTYPKTVLGYELIAASDNAEGTREEDVIHVYYTYKLKNSTVVVNYVDINGKEIAESETLNGKVFEEYKTEAKQINGYQLTMLPGNANGTFAENQQVVNYVYALKGSGVIANYVDEAGNKLAESVAQYGNVFDEYSTSAKEIKGYELVAVPENAEGELTEELITVNYVYRLKDSKIIINYVDEDGNEIAESDIVSGKVFDSYSTSAKNIYEYSLISSTNNTSGEMTEEDILVVYTYKKVLNIDTGKPDVNIDTDKDGKPDVNIDTDKDGKPDVNIDTDGDGKPDVNIDTDKDGKPDINIDTDGDGKPDINIDTDGDGKPDINIDTDGDGKPDINIDTDGDGKTDINIDTDGDGKADINIDTDGDSKADINIDTDDDGKADINLDLDGDGIADANIDTNGDGIADKNIIGAVDTGSSDMFRMIMYTAISIVAAFLILVLMMKNKKKEKEA
ncbi:MAG: hypothetical protein HFJ98_03665 [Eubacterium sp.]|nr:hypothetical protein [Eubacterium sp.]